MGEEYKATADAIVDQLTTFRRQVINNEFDAAKETRVRVLNMYNRLRAQERSSVARARLARDSTTRPLEERQQLSELIREAVTTSLQRASFAATADWFLTAPEENDTTEVVRRVDETVESERTFQEMKETVETSNLRNLPPQVIPVAVDQPVTSLVTGDAFEITVTVENVGDAVATDVVAAVTVKNGATFEPRERFIGKMERADRVPVTFHGTAETVGTHTVTVNVDWSDGQASQTAMIQVGDGTTITPEAALPFPAPDWATVAAGGGVLGSGAAYGIHRYLRDEIPDEAGDSN